MSVDHLAKHLAQTRVELEWTRYLALEMLRAIRPSLTRESAESLARRVQAAVAALDQHTANLPNDQQRATAALAFLAAVREALELPPG